MTYFVSLLWRYSFRDVYRVEETFKARKSPGEGDLGAGHLMSICTISITVWIILLLITIVFGSSSSSRAERSASSQTLGYAPALIYIYLYIFILSIYRFFESSPLELFSSEGSWELTENGETHANYIQMRWNKIGITLSAFEQNGQRDCHFCAKWTLL